MREPDASRPGSVLRAEREALGITVREVAETLNLSMVVVEAIEADDHARLPGPVFARGYVRAYARLLDLEPQSLMRHYPQAEEAPAAEAPSEPPVWEWIRRRPALVLGGAGVLAVLMLVLLVALLWPGDEPPSRAQAQPGEVAPGESVTPEQATTSEQWTTQDDPPAEPDATLAGAETAAAVPPEPPAAEPADAAGTESDVGPDGARRITDAGEERLRFAFSDDCWVEVRSASGASLYSDLNRAGSELELVGRGPFRILLGYAPGVRLTFNGEPVPLAPYTRNNVATLVLGQ